MTEHPWLMALSALVETHRRDLAELTRLAENDLRVLFRRFSTAEQARDGLIDALPALVAMYGSAAATLAADWYDEMREAAEVKGRFRAIPAELPDQGRTDALARWGVDPMFAAEPDPTAALVLVTGGLQRIVANASRESVTLSAVADPGADGWQRVGSGTSCAFCSMLLGRGTVYRESSADFASHDHCNCGAVPAWGGQPVPVKPYTPGSRHGNKADYDRAREYIRTH